MRENLSRVEHFATEYIRALGPKIKETKPQDIVQWAQEFTNALHEVKQADFSGFALEKIERQVIEQALSTFKTREEVADALGMNQSTLWRKRRKYNL